MKEVKMYSVMEVLLTPTFKGNQSKLAEYLNINRGTLREALEDTECTHCCVLLLNGKYQFRKTTSRITKT